MTSPDIAAVAGKLTSEERDRRTMTDPQRMLWRDDVEGVCPSPDMCFEYGDHVRCGPCAIKQASLAGIESDLSVPNLPEVYRLRRILRHCAEADPECAMFAAPHLLENGGGCASLSTEGNEG